MDFTVCVKPDSPGQQPGRNEQDRGADQQHDGAQQDRDTLRAAQWFLRGEQALEPAGRDFTIWHANEARVGGMILG